MATAEKRVCQNCKAQFTIEPADFDFYKKMDVPPPTWCPECRMIRRFVWRNERQLFRKKDLLTSKDVFSDFPEAASVKIYDRDYWWSDAWDPMQYGRDYDFKRSFFEQYQEFILGMPWPSRVGINQVNSGYASNCSDVKNCYLVFYGSEGENSAYVIAFENVKESFDMYQSRHSELCYEGYMVDEAQRVFFSTNIEESHDVWFSKNLLGCSNCFASTNLRNKSNYIFNKPVSKEEYKKFITEFKSGSYKHIEEYLKKAEELWMKHPQRFTLGIRTTDCIGEHIENSKNVKYSYSVHDGEDLKYCQYLDRAKDSYDQTLAGRPSSRIYESLQIVFECDNVRFSFRCYPSVEDTEYSINCNSSSNLFGCFGLKKKQYCIFNKQYSKEEYQKVRQEIIEQMKKVPYIDRLGREYRYGEFFPPEFSPWAYNETIAQDFFPLTKEEAFENGYSWRDVEQKEFKITKKAADLPDDIKDVTDDILKQVIGCSSCGKAYQIIPMELAFYRRIPLPLPRLCPTCRFDRRFKFVNPPTLWPGKCQCAGAQSDNGVYKNEVKHIHDNNHCPNTFETSYAPGRPEIVYCEKCYQQEVV